MVSQHARARAPIVVGLMAATVLLGAVLSGCAPQSSSAQSSSAQNTQAGTPTSSSSATSSSTAAATPTATPTGPATTNPTDVPTAVPEPAPSSTPSGNPAAKALIVQACETISDGFAADRVAAAAPLAAQAAAADTGWQPLAVKLEFIHTHPINPDTGAGPQATIDYSASVAHDCFTLAGVTVSQD